jgi:hypothetical protein
MHRSTILRELGPTYSPLSLDVAPLGGGPATGVGDFTDTTTAVDNAAVIFTEFSRAVDAGFTPVMVDWRIVRARVR